MTSAITYDEMLSICDEERESDGFCSCSSACSGPALSNLACDYPFPEGCEVYRGGNHGSCKFVVVKEE